MNSPLKPPTQNTNKDSAAVNGVPGRRTSVSQVQNVSNNYTGSSPSSRPGTRRRESSDVLRSSNSLASPTGNTQFFRDEPTMSTPPPSLRRRTDIKEGGFGPSLEDGDAESSKPSSLSESTTPFSNLKRSFTGPASADLNGPSSPWSATPQSARFSPMGAFGNFSLEGAPSQPATADKKPGFSTFRGESRFKVLMSAEKSEETKSRIKEKGSLSSLERLAESANEQAMSWGSGHSIQPSGTEKSANRHQEDGPTGSAALGGDDASPPRPQPSRYRVPDRQASYDEMGFSSLGMSSDIPPFREAMQRRDYTQLNTPQAPNQGVQSNEPMSPTNTNPYQSPEGEEAVPQAVPQDYENDDSDLAAARFQGAGQYGYPPRAIQSQFDGASDRSRTSSVGAQRSFPNLGSLGGLGGLGTASWSAAPGAVGTLSKATPGFSTGFADSIFSPLSDISSPSHGGLGGSGLYGAGNPSGALGAIGRGSKTTSMFPHATQEQMRGDQFRQEQGQSDGGESYLRNLPVSNAPGMGSGMRDSESSSRLGRVVLDDLFGNLDIRSRGTPGANPSVPREELGQMTLGQVTASTSSQAPFSAPIGTPSLASTAGNSYFGRTQDQGYTSADASQMPATQQRQMVMPDRMRWIYRDPQGTTQGPWSGLEMHDWYKAGFFSPELQVKKLEDADYEPLAQLIRRIGNSREPFLVPQIGIPHGSASAMPSSNAPASGSVPATTPSAAQSSSAQPPFASSFPSFGTTLTAEQQNALERRKQEEQYLMARQKEHLAQQQVMIKQMQHMQGGPHSIHGQQLHHHSSAHSLQSQPSYGSITSPTGYQPSPAQGPIQPPATVPNFFDPLSRNAGPLGVGPEALGSVREDELPGFMERVNAGRGNQLPFTGQSYNTSQQDSLSHQQQVQAMLQERARLQREQEQYEILQRGSDENRVTAERYEQYHQLRSQMEEQQRSQPHGGELDQIGKPTPEIEHQQRVRDISSDYGDAQQATLATGKLPEPLSMTEQVQKAAAKRSPMGLPQSPWAKIESSLPQPFPPPQSSSPLPAPAAQRNRSNVADALAAESRSASQTPSLETPNATIAPWAKENNDFAKGPSLKEIQAVEARKAAQQEEIAAAARKALAEHERLNQPQAVAPAPGLPSSANWATGVSPAVPQSTGPSAWAKPVAGKPTTSTPVANAKKTLAQIQKEEEARKHRAAAAAAANAATNTSNVVPTAGGKRYADLAGKATLPNLQSASSAWTTVGASGKVKTPTGPAPALGARAASAGIVQPPAQVTKPKTPVHSNRSLTAGASGPGQQNANEEFQKWAKAALSKGLNSNIPGNSIPLNYQLANP